MKTKTKMVWLELIGGLFGWTWILASLACVYFLAVALFGSGPWAHVGWAFGTGAIAKWLARGFNDHKGRVAFTADLMAQGYSAEAAGEEWYAQYTGQKRVPNTALKPMTNEESIKIISAYGEALVDRQSAYGDISELPYPKERIKEALIHGIRETNDAQMREQMKGAYITLGQWQPGFGARRGAGELTEEDLKDPTKAMARIQASGGDFQKIPQEIAAEAEVLMADLKARGLA